MTKPYQRISNTHGLLQFCEEREEDIAAFAKKYFGLSLEGFDSYEHAQQFASKFPKYVKVYASTCHDSVGVKTLDPLHYDKNGIRWFPHVGGMGFVSYSVNISFSNLNKVTGEKNETADKRLLGFIRTLKKEGFL